jgi:6-phosphogluconolactonase
MVGLHEESSFVVDSKLEVKRFPDAEALARGVASDVAGRLAQAYATRGNATLVVSGGRSPVGFFEELGARGLDWRKVTITLADERWVEASDPGSNERLVREVLLRGNAAVARFIGLKNGAPSPELGAAAAWRALARLPRPFDVTILGMGMDGQMASLFSGLTRSGGCARTRCRAGLCRDVVPAATSHPAELEPECPA